MTYRFSHLSDIGCLIVRSKTSAYKLFGIFYKLSLTIMPDHVHCRGHYLNLVLVKTCSSMPEVRIYFANSSGSFFQNHCLPLHKQVGFKVNIFAGDFLLIFSSDSIFSILQYNFMTSFKQNLPSF